LATLDQSVKRIKRSDTEKELLKVVSLNDQKALNLNRDVQLFDEGSDAKGTFLSPEYAPITVLLKRQSGQPTNRVTLRDTEAFHNSFFMDTSSFPVRIDATDSKTAELKDKYGVDIFGLDNESLDEFTDFILSDVQDLYREIVGAL